jgi:hypothetical protein
VFHNVSSLPEGCAPEPDLLSGSPFIKRHGPAGVSRIEA